MCIGEVVWLALAKLLYLEIMIYVIVIFAGSGILEGLIWPACLQKSHGSQHCLLCLFRKLSTQKSSPKHQKLQVVILQINLSRVLLNKFNSQHSSNRPPLVKNIPGPGLPVFALNQIHQKLGISVSLLPMLDYSIGLHCYNLVFTLCWLLGFSCRNTPSMVAVEAAVIRSNIY